MVYDIIINPNSGNGRGLKIWNNTKRILDGMHIDYTVYFTTGCRDAIRKAGELTADKLIKKHIVVLGGDGTVNEVLNGICLDSPVTLSYIPTGSGNDLARGMDLERNLKKHISEVFGNGRIEMVDYGVMTLENGSVVRRFAVSSGTGYDASVCARLNGSRIKDVLNKAGLGKLSYIVEGTKEFFANRPVKGYLILDNEKRVDFNNIFFVSAHIVPYEGGGFKFAPLADNKDGYLEICVINSKNKLKTAPVLIDAKFKGVKDEYGVKAYQCREARLHLDRPCVVHTDGEILDAHQDIEFRCVRQRLAFKR